MSSTLSLAREQQVDRSFHPMVRSAESRGAQWKKRLLVGAGVGMREGMLPTRGTSEWDSGECMEREKKGQAHGTY